MGRVHRTGFRTFQAQGQQRTAGLGTSPAVRARVRESLKGRNGAYRAGSVVYGINVLVTATTAGNNPSCSCPTP
ncbi:hypothetical protein GCM10009736_66560 [Actinomadura bangladeshensis]